MRALPPIAAHHRPCHAIDDMRHLGKDKACCCRASALRLQRHPALPYCVAVGAGVVVAAAVVESGVGVAAAAVGVGVIVAAAVVGLGVVVTGIVVGAGVIVPAQHRELASLASGGLHCQL